MPTPQLLPSRAVRIADLSISDTRDQTIVGEIVAIKDGYKLRVRDGSGEVLVDAGLRGRLPTGFAPRIGDQITVTGRNDDSADFDAMSITTAAGAGFTIDRRGE